MILALDVGFAATGWAIFEEGNVIDCGVIRTEKSKKKLTRIADDHANRSAVLAEGLRALLSKNYSYERGRGGKVDGIVGELPSGGAQSAKAMGFMMSAIAVVATVAHLQNLPAEWCSPGDVKEALGGTRNASKETIMENACSRFGWSKAGTRFMACGHTFPKGDWEHIADAIGAYLALRLNNLVRMFG